MGEGVGGLWGALGKGARGRLFQFGRCWLVKAEIKQPGDTSDVFPGEWVAIFHLGSNKHTLVAIHALAGWGTLPFVKSGEQMQQQQQQQQHLAAILLWTSVDA